MIELLVAYFKQRLEVLDIFSEVKGLTDRLKETKDGKEVMYPAEYCKNGEYKPVHVKDFNSGIAYLRLGSMVQDASESEITGCDQKVTILLSMFVIASVRKDVYKTDNQFIDSTLANNISRSISTPNQSQIANTIKANFVQIRPRTALLNRQEVFENEYKGFEITDIDYNTAFVKVEFEVEISIEKQCWKLVECDGEFEIPDFIPNLSTLSCDRFSELTSIQKSECILTHYTIAELVAGLNNNDELRQELLCEILWPEYLGFAAEGEAIDDDDAKSLLCSFLTYTI